MPFAQDAGYTPKDFDTILGEIRVELNAQVGTSYSDVDFVGTNYYKFCYVLAQRVQLSEVKASEIFQKLQEYISATNQKIQRPSVSWPGIEESFESNGFIASVKPPADVDAGKISVCVDLTGSEPGYAAMKTQILQLLSQYVVGGVVSQGTETGNVLLSNTQSFLYKYYLRTAVPVLLRATVAVSSNTTILPPTDVALRTQIQTSINALYRLGKNFEPQRYFNQDDALWAASVLLEYSLDGGSTWLSTVYVSNFDAKITFSLADITVVGLP